jgi:hypothetical protein
MVATEASVPAECEVETVQARPHHISWAGLLKHVFEIDMQRCPNCGAGELKIGAAILERPVIEKILTHLGLDPQPRHWGRAREAEHDFAAWAMSAVNETRHRPQICSAAGVSALTGWEQTTDVLISGPNFSLSRRNPNSDRGGTSQVAITLN